MITIDQFGTRAKVPAELRGNAEFTLRILNEIFAAFPANYFRFTSGYRTPEHNKAINGVPNSFHLKALAADFVPNNGRFLADDKSKINQIIGKYGYELVQHNVGSGMHYHIEPSPRFDYGLLTGAASQTVSSGNNYLIYAFGFILVFLLLDD